MDSLFMEKHMRMRTFLAVMVVTMILVSLPSCAKRQDTSQVKSVPSPQSKAPAKAPVQTPPAPKTETVRPAAPTATLAYFGQVLVTWNSGKKDEAIQQFVAIRWDDPAAFQGIPILTMTEPQFATLSQVQRDQVAQQAQDLLKVIREMAKAVVATGDNMAAAGNAAGAKACFESVERFGQALAGPDHLSIVQLVGKAVTQLGQDKFSAK